MSGRGRTGNSLLTNLPFGLGYHDISKEGSKEIPSIALPVNNPVNERERLLSVRYIKFQQTIRDGPFFTGSLEMLQDSATEKHKSKDGSEDVLYEGALNDGIDRYSDRYLKKRKIGVSIDEYPFHLQNFPEELYKTMGFNKKKILKLSKLNDKDDIFTGNADDDSKGLSMLEQLKELAENIDENDEDENENETKPAESEDDDFDDDSDNDDYNAEKYFDDGDDDFGGGDDYGDEPAF